MARTLAFPEPEPDVSFGFRIDKSHGRKQDVFFSGVGFGLAYPNYLATSLLRNRVAFLTTAEQQHHGVCSL
jgi:hypothetical protein